MAATEPASRTREAPALQLEKAYAQPKQQVQNSLLSQKKKKKQPPTLFFAFRTKSKLSRTVYKEALPDRPQYTSRASSLSNLSCQCPTLQPEGNTCSSSNAAHSSLTLLGYECTGPTLPVLPDLLVLNSTGPWNLTFGITFPIRLSDPMPRTPSITLPKKVLLPCLLNGLCLGPGTQQVSHVY